MIAAAAARRADWRFLLPDPRPGRVAYLGRPDPTLVAALELAGAAVDTLDHPECAAGHELVVITGGRTGDVAAARGLLRGGGWLYAEVPGLRVRAWERALGRAGFHEIASHWLFPDEHDCREIVPLERRALSYALRRRDPGARLRLRAHAAGLLVHAGAFRFAVRRAAVIGRWRA
jgi:hypothetical protein